MVSLAELGPHGNATLNAQGRPSFNQLRTSYPLHSGKWAVFGDISSLRSISGREHSVSFPDHQKYLRKGASEKVVGW